MSATLPAELAGGKHRLLGLIGQGGMGKVYKAYQTDLKRVVAIKTLLAGEQASEAFLLHYVEGLDYRQVGQITAVSAGTARVRAFRARGLLRAERGAVVDTLWLTA